MTGSKDGAHFLEQIWPHRHRILEAVNGQSLLLPSLPDIILRVRTAIADQNCSDRRLTALLSRDPQLTARLLKVVNAAAHYRGQPVTSLAAAVTRLGHRRIDMLVTSVALLQLMLKSESRAHAGLLMEYARRSQIVGEYAHALAPRAGLDPEMALLGGIVHAIGVLPVVHYAQQQAIGRDDASLAAAVEMLYPEVGSAVLEAWKFPPELVALAADHPQLNRAAWLATDYTDLVTAGLVHYYRNRHHPLYSASPSQIFALRRLGFSRVDRGLAEIPSLLG